MGKTLRLDYIDALRGYAILAVMAAHIFPSFTNGARGVQLFFVTSAIALMMSWRAREDGIAAFYVRRLFRIMPMFLLAVAIFGAMNLGRPSYFAPHGVEVWQVWLTVFLLHGWHPQSVSSVVPGGWSIAAEAAFYVLFPILALTVMRLRTALILTALSIAASPLIRAAAIAFWAPRLPADQAYLVADFAFLWFPFQIPCFLIGISVFLTIREFRVSQSMASCLLVAALLMIPTVLWLPHGQFAAMVGLLGVIAFAFAKGGGGMLVNRAVTSLGRISYSAYFWHLGLLSVSASLAPAGWTYSLYAAAVFALTIIFSTLTYRFVEWPAVRLGNALIASRRDGIPRAFPAI